MALSFVGSAENSGTADPITVTFPGGVAQNDVVYVAGGLSTVSDHVLTVGTGYTELAELYHNDTNDANFEIARKVMGATPDSTVDCTTGNSATNTGKAWVLHVWRGVDTTTPEDATTTTATGGDSSNVNSPSITTVTNNAVVLTCGLGAEGASTTPTPTAPTGYANQVDVTGATTGRTAVAVMASKSVATAGAEDPGAWTGMTSAVQNSWAAATVAIRPAAEGGGGVTYPSLERGVRGLNRGIAVGSFH